VRIVKLGNDPHYNGKNQ